MYKWMDWIISPKVNAEVAEWFGERRPNRSRAGDGRQEPLHDLPRYDEAYFSKVSYWTTKRTQCGDDRGSVCKDYAAWVQAWTRSGIGGAPARATASPARAAAQRAAGLAGRRLPGLARRPLHLGLLAARRVQGEIVRSPPFDNFKLLWENDVLQDDRLPHDRDRGTRHGNRRPARFPIAFFMAKVASGACAGCCWSGSSRRCGLVPGEGLRGA